MHDYENRHKRQFYIDRQGQEHRFEGDCEDIISVHYQIAKKLHPNLERPEDKLLQDGWVLVGSTVYNCPIIHQMPSPQQLDKLMELNLLQRLCFLYKNTYPNFVKYRALIEPE